jgi:GAF domain-containing protein/DNA-binding response OmpR family regulator
MQVSSARTIYRRALRLVIPFIIIVSLVAGIAALIILRAGARNALIENQQFELASTFTDAQRRIDRLGDEVLLLANTRVVRAFARETLLPGSAALERTQLEMAREFAETLERSPEVYVSVRYVTFNGAVWTEANTDENGIVQINRALRQGELSSEPLVARTAGVTPNNVVLDGITFRRSPRLSFEERQRPILRIAAPVDTGSDIFSVAGMVMLDVDASALMREIRQAMNITADVETGRRLALVDNRGALLYDTDARSTDYLLDIFRGTPVLAADALPDGLLTPQNDLAGLARGFTIASTFSLRLGTATNAEAWRAVLIDNEVLALADGVALGVVVFIVIQVFSFILIVFIGASLRRALRPIDEVRTTAARLAGEVEALERLPSALPGSARTIQPAAPTSTIIPGETITPDVAELLNAFHTLSERVITLQRELEAQRGRYTRSIDVAARVSRETASLYNIDELLNRAIRQICEEYGFYHAQVFLIDDVGENAVLVYSYGERGRQLLESGHRLGVGSASVIGRVTQSGRPVIVNDTQAPGSGHKFNPLLPDTRAELAVPLQYADRTIGALDIQSVTPNVFPPEDVRVFQMIADQIAVAIQNVRLLMQSEERFAQIDTLNRQLMQKTMETETADLQGKGYSYDLMKITPAAPTPPPDAHSEPIRIRGEVIGSIEAAAPGAMLSESDRALMRTVAERVGIAIENARLFEETQASLLETFTLYQLSRYLNEATTLEEIVGAIVSAVMPDVVCGQIAIFDGYPKGERPQWLEVAADWQVNTRPAREVLLNGLEIHMADHPILSAMTETDIVLVSDIERDTRLDDTLRSLFASLNVRAAVFVPFSVRGVWRGILVMEFPEPRTFTEREGRSYTALIDQAGVAIEARLLLRQNELALADIERLYTGSRIINMAQSLPELVRAAVETSAGSGLDFELGAFVGEVDATGWSTSLHMVARSFGEQVIESEEVIAMPVPLDSPLRRRKVLRVQDLDSAAHTPLLQYVRSRGARTATVLPLFSSNQPIALFFILGREARYLSDEDIEVYRALTGQMSIVLQNRRLLEQTARALDETRRLYAATRAITSAPDLDRVYAAAAKGITADVPAISRLSVLTAPGASISASYLDYAYTYLRDESLYNDFAVGMRVPRAAIPFADIVEDEPGAVYFQDVRADDGGFPSLRALAERNSTRALILAPMQTRQRFYGIVLIESDQPNAFAEPFVNLVQAITDQLAIAVDGIAAFNEAQLQAQRALALAEAGQLASAVGGEFVQSIGEVFARVAQPAQYDRWLLVLVNDDGTFLEKVVQRLPGVTQSGNEQEERYSLETDRTPLTLAFLQNQSLLVNEPAAFPTLETLPEPVLDLYGKHLVAPVRLAGKAIGALMVGRSRSAADLDENDEQLVRTLAAQIAIAVENRRLFSAAESERERLSTVLNTLPAGVAVLDAATFRPIQYNEQAASLLGEALVRLEPLSVETYHLLVSGSSAPYKEDNLPFRRAARTGLPASANDVALLRDDGQEFDLLITAAPLVDARGTVSAIVTAFQDISGLRALERTLENNLRSTLALYETSRALSEANTIEDVLDQVMLQVSTQEPTHAYIVLLDPNDFTLTLARRYDTRALEDQPARDPARLLDWSLPEDILDPEQVLLVRDVAESYELDEAVRMALLKEDVQALAVLPLRTRREVPLGWMVLAFDHLELFPPDVEQFLVTLSDSASVALDNRYLFRSTTQALDETGKVYDATAMISRARSLAGISEALQRSLATLKAPIYAGYLRTGSGALVELFNISMDSEPIDFATLLEEHSFSELMTTFVDDLRALTEPNPLEVALQRLGTLRAVSILPLQSQETVSGVLLIAFHEPHRFQGGEGRYLSAVADSASVVIDNYLLVERIQSTLEETSSLYLAGRALTDSTEPEEVLEIVSQYLLNPAVTQAFLVQLMTTTWDAPNAMARVSAMWTAPDSGVVDLTGITLGAEQFPAWSIFATPELLIVDDIDEYDGLDETGRIGLYSLDLRSLLVLPLRAGGRALGSIVIGSNIVRRHDEREIRTYRSFIEQASLRLDANRALRQAERRARQLVTSSEVSQIAGTLLDLDRLLPQIVDLIKDRFEYDHVQIFLMDDKDEYALLRASTGEAGRQLLSIRHRLKKGSQSVIGQVTANARATIAADTADARVVHRPNPYLPNTRSEMAIPLILKGRVVGALDVQSNVPNAFDSDDVLVLTTLAGQVATAIDNAQLYEQARGRASEMSFLYSVTNAAARAETLEDAVGNVAEELAHSLNAISAAIYLPEAYIDADEQEFTLLVPIAQAGSDQPLSELSEIRLDTAQNLIASVATSRRPLVLSDLTAEPRYLPIVENARSAIIVPLGTASTLVGLITMEGDRPGAFTDDTLQLLLTLSGTLSAIVQNQQLLQQVQRQNEDLQELDRLKSDFLANMSHELRTPLNSIIGFSRVILKGIDGPLTEMQEQDLTTIYNSGMHLLNLINDILDQAKIAAGKMDLQFDYFEIRPVIDGVRSIGIGLVKDKPIDIIVDLAPGMPKAYGDEFRIRQVLLNLVSNASKFTREGSITISAYAVRDEETGQTMVRVDVTDTGIGIAEKDIPLLFEAFRQVDSSLTRTAGGTGLGLPIAKSLVEIQGGRMLVRSTVNVGSTFSVLLPIEPVVDPDAPPKRKTDDLNATPTSRAALRGVTGHLRAPQEPARDETQDTQTDITRIMTRKRQILLIEDNPEMVDQFRRALAREGYEIFAATIPLEAEAMASGLHPTIIIMDVNFANGTGWNILRNLQSRDDTMDIPVIVVSLSDQVDEARQAGAFTFIRRPFVPEDIVEAVKQAEAESRVDRILIIDDNPEHARLIEQILSQHGRYKVFSANNGMDGIAMVARRRPNLILLDLRMPDMDGFRVIQELRANPETATIPILIVTGETLTSAEREQLMNLAVLFKSNIASNEYRELLDGVNAYLDGD